MARRRFDAGKTIMLVIGTSTVLSVAILAAIASALEHEWGQ